MNKLNLLKRRYALLAKSYTFFMLMLFSTAASAGTGQVATITLSLLILAFFLTLPVLLHNYRLHLAIKEVEPSAPSIGLSNAIVSSLLFTPFEAAIVQPPFNILIARRLLTPPDQRQRRQ